LADLVDNPSPTTNIYMLRNAEAAPQTAATALQIDASLLSRAASASTAWIESMLTLASSMY
jgi:hypothetical protein